MKWVWARLKTMDFRNLTRPSAESTGLDLEASGKVSAGGRMLVVALPGLNLSGRMLPVEFAGKCALKFYRQPVECFRRRNKKSTWSLDS